MTPLDADARADRHCALIASATIVFGIRHCAVEAVTEPRPSVELAALGDALAFGTGVLPVGPF